MNQLNNNTKERKGKHLCLWERKEIEKALRCGAGVREIARLLERSPSSISREIKRGTVTQRVKKKYISSKAKDTGYTEKEVYFADTGQRICQRNTGRRGGKYKLFADMNLVKEIEEKILKFKWSPDAIIGVLKTQGHNYKTMVCTKTVYNYIDRGLLAVKNIDLLLKTRLKTNKRRIRQQKRILGKSIELRPATVEAREEFGHWEADSVVGKNNGSAIMTIVERITNKGFMLHLKDKGADAVMEAFKKLQAELGTAVFKSITFDNGSEFARCYELENDGIGIYFAHPYSAFERGINEHYNGIIRRFIPKGKELSKISQKELNRINNMIDSLPRKRLNYKSAETAFAEQLAKFSYHPRVIGK